MNTEDIIRKNKEKRKNLCANSVSKISKMSPKLKYVKGLISRSLVAIIFVLVSVIFTRSSDKNLTNYKKYVLENSLEFTKINNLYQSIFGKVDIINSKKSNTSSVFNSIDYKNIENYKNGVKLTVGMNDTVNVIASGIVVFIGEKDNLGNTVIVQGNDGYDIWYSNITDTNIKIYDYIESGSILGTSNNEYIYITIKKDDKYISYEEYQNLI